MSPRAKTRGMICTMRNKLLELEKISRLLEPSAGERKEVRKKIVSYTEDFIKHIEKIKAYNFSPENGAGLLNSPISENGIPIDEAISLIEKNVDHPGLNPASGGHLGYIPGGGIYYSALGDYLADITNRYAGIMFAGPGAVRMENLLTDWMAEIVGYPKGAGGNLTSGGGIANLAGIVAAREASGLKSKEFERSTIYLTEQAHHSVDKAIRIAGLKECLLRHVPTDRQHRMDAASLERSIAEDRRQGLHPWLVIASAGTTDTGAVDPLDAIAGIANARKLWFHVDGAYGAFFVLSDEANGILKGMEKSDSLVMDPHKGLFLPYGSGAVLVRERKSLYDAFWYQANYLQDAR